MPLGTIAFDSGEVGFGDPWNVPSSNAQPGARIFAVSGAVPEPSTYGLIGSLFLLALVGLRRRAAG